MILVRYPPLSLYPLKARVAESVPRAVGYHCTPVESEGRTTVPAAMVEATSRMQHRARAYIIRKFKEIYREQN